MPPQVHTFFQRCNFSMEEALRETRTQVFLSLLFSNLPVPYKALLGKLLPALAGSLLIFVVKGLPLSLHVLAIALTLASTGTAPPLL
jgi:hypothetical protein